jgi:hypothetical protein
MGKPARTVLGALVAIVAIAPARAADWKPVPNQRGVFVDMAHIRHIPAVADSIPGPDTKVDIMRYGKISEVYVSCGNGGMEPKDIPIAEIQPDLPGGATTVGVISIKALRAVVCAPEKNRS